jgi:threonine aldolase
VKLDPQAVETNIVIFEVDDAPGLVQRVADQVELGAVGSNQVRGVTHLDVTTADVDRAIAAVSAALR